MSDFVSPPKFCVCGSDLVQSPTEGFLVCPRCYKIHEVRRVPILSAEWLSDRILQFGMDGETQESKMVLALIRMCSDRAAGRGDRVRSVLEKAEVVGVQHQEAVDLREDLMSGRGLVPGIEDLDGDCRATVRNGMMSEKPVLVWVDLETTGLDPQKDEILEIAAVPTDIHLVTLDQSGPIFHALVEYDTVGKDIDPVVREMHTTNGLFSEVEALGSEAGGRVAVRGLGGGT